MSTEGSYTSGHGPSTAASVTKGTEGTSGSTSGVVYDNEETATSGYVSTTQGNCVWF